MSTVLSTLKASKHGKLTRVEAATSGIHMLGLKSSLLIPVPGVKGINLRWKLLLKLLRIISNSKSSSSIVTGAIMCVLVLFAESPGALIQRIVDDPDVSIRLVDVIEDKDGELTFASRGLDLAGKANDYFALGRRYYAGEELKSPFLNPDRIPREIEDPDEFNLILASVCTQIWTLLAKAVTAPATAQDSEDRRWTKYTQQRRVHSDIRLSKEWTDTVRAKISQSLSLRRFMVNLMIEVKKTPGHKPRLAELIIDVDNYIEEAGLAGFILTVKYAIDTKYPAIALHEFQGELTTLEHLMKLYLEMGQHAPYMVILENSLQNKFSPGNYPLIWSYAIGVGVELEKSMAGLNYNRPYFDMSYFRLGQEMVRRFAGVVSHRVAEELNISEEEREILKEVSRAAGTHKSTTKEGPRQSSLGYLGTDPERMTTDEQLTRGVSRSNAEDDRESVNLTLMDDSDYDDDQYEEGPSQSYRVDDSSKKGKDTGMRARGLEYLRSLMVGTKEPKDREEISADKTTNPTSSGKSDIPTANQALDGETEKSTLDL
ncbi:nucleocapsid protein [Salem virus]|uniref:Nucleocapsid n=1 Tax=Salem virus TaxID=120499 RepID=Q9IZC1_9MONO|nr:nucleocapsid protein [Salem virus]AAF63741.2 nucleocapsid protein [Salem virus]